MRGKRYRVFFGFFALALLLHIMIGGSSLVLRVLGVKHLGTVEAALAASPPQAVEEAAGEPLDSIAIECPVCQSGTYSVQDLGIAEVTGRLNAEGQPEYRLLFDEAGFNRLFQSRMAFSLWDASYQHLWFDLRDGGVVVHADVDVDPSGGFSLPFGVPYLGISSQRTEQGFEVAGILALSPADRAGLRVGDVVYEVDGTPAMDVLSLRDWVQSHTPGDVVMLGVVREGREMILQVEVGWWEEDERWHCAGLVLIPDATGSRLVPLGLSLGQGLYSLPETGPLADAIADGQRRMDEMFEQLLVVGPFEGEARVASISFTEDSMVFVMR